MTNGHGNGHDCHLCGHHTHSLWEELVCHVPYAVFSIATGFIALSLIHFLALGVPEDSAACGYHMLFHTFHYLHIMVAVAGASAMFFRYSRRIAWGFLIAVISPTFFCILSDILLPTLAGRMLGVQIPLHVCFFNLHDGLNMVAFMVAGLVSGLALLFQESSVLRPFALTSHFIHILASAMASMFYMVSFGLENWYESMGFLFLFLFFAVLVPCTISDIVVPLYCARHSKQR